MVERNITFEQREKTLELFLRDLQGYKKKNRKFNETSGLQSPMWYVVGIPPYTKKMTVYGNHPGLESRLILFSDYLLFLTEWTPEKALKTKKLTAGSFLKEFASEGISQLTWGVSDILGAAFNAVIPSESMALLGKKPEELLSNPWSLIIPLDDIDECELLKVSFTIHYLYLHIKHRFEGDLDVGITYHSGGIHTRADGLYKKLRNLLAELPQRQKNKPAATLVELVEKDKDQESFEALSNTQSEKSLSQPSVDLHPTQILTHPRNNYEAESVKSIPATSHSANEGNDEGKHQSVVDSLPKSQKIDIAHNGMGTIQPASAKSVGKEDVKYQSDSHVISKFQSNKNSQRPGKNTLNWAIISILSITSLVLLYFFIDTQNRLDSTRGRLNRALDTIDIQNDEILSLQSKLDNTNSQIYSLNSEIDSLNSDIDSLNLEIDSLNSRIESSNRLKIVRFDVQNNNCNNVFIFADGRLAAATRGGGFTYFYITPGDHNIQACNDPYRSSCGSEKTWTLNTTVFDFTVTKNSSCP